jgi:putative transposase
MEHTLEKGCHSVYAIQFHLVLCDKHRKRILTRLLDERLKEIVDEMSAQFGIRIIQQETDIDHIHILFPSRPSIAPSRFVNSLKSVVSRRLRQELPLVMRKHLRGGVFWSPSYFLASTGQVTLKAIRHYVETEEEAESR